MRRNRAFTLIELTLVLVILAILAAAVGLRLEGTLHRGQMRDVISGIAGFDGLSRTQARESGRPVRLVVDVREGELRRTDERGDQALGAPWALPHGFRITGLRVRGKDVPGDRTVIPCSAHGLTPTYAIQVEGPGPISQWLLFAGLSGESIEVSDARDLQ